MDLGMGTTLEMGDPKTGHGRSHPNLAVIKYWGKANISNNIPSNTSISFLLPKFTTETSVEHSAFDEFYLNGEKFPLKERMRLVIEMFRKKAGDSRPICIRSSNNFLHGCGLASSASGFAALTLAFDDFYGLGLSKTELSEIARFGSGSAGRSIFPGIAMLSGLSAHHICYWPEIRIFSIILSKKHKKIGSTEGMIRTGSTSYFYRDRLNRVEERARNMVEYISQRDFEKFAELTMRESNELHAILMETYPPVRYIEDKGFKVIEMCHEFNNSCIKVAYTFDAGPNPFLITLEKYSDNVREAFRDYEMLPCN